MKKEKVYKGGNKMENLENGVANETAQALPAEVSIWTKVKNFLFQEITVTLTPKQQKVFQEVHDFWHQEITAKGIHDFLFQEIKIVDNITL